MTNPKTQPPDPFLEEANRHGWLIPRNHNYIRDNCRANVDNCERCKELVAAFDVVLMGAFLDGTGPFG